MSDFSAKIQAILDTSNIPKDISKIEKTPIKFNNVSLDTNNLINQIQTALNNHSFTINFNGANLTNQMQQMGASAGNTFSNSMNSRLRINPFTGLNVNSSEIKKIGDELNNLQVPQNTIKNIVGNLNNLDLAVTKITTSIGKNSIRLNISGVDELGKAISLTQTFSQKTGSLINSNKTITQSFKQSQSAIKASNSDMEKAVELLKRFFSARAVRDNNLSSNAILANNANNDLTTIITEYAKIYQNLSKEQKLKLDSSEILTAFNRMKDLQKSAAETFDKTQKIDPANTQELNALINLMQRYQYEYNNLMGGYRGRLNDTQLNELENLAQSTATKFNLLSAAAQDAQNKLQTKIKSELTDGTLKSKISQVTAEYQRLGETGHEKLTSIKQDIDNLNKLQADMKTQSGEELSNSYKKFGDTLKTVQNKLKTVSSETKNVVSNLKLDTFDNNMVAWLEKNSKAAGQFGSSIADLRERLAQLKASGNATVPQFRQLQEEFRNIQSAARAAGLTGRNTASLFKESLSILTRYFSATTLIFRAISGFKQMCQTVVEVNTAMTGLYRITNLSAQQYEVLYDKMITSAKEYGATLTDIINSTSSWIRLGFNENVAERLSEITAMYMHVTDLDYDTAVKNLVTAYKGFSDQLLGMFDNDTAKSVEYVADIFDKLGNEMPVSAAQVGEGLTRCASVMQQAGATIEEASAMITGGGAITQDFATMGSALKIASLRIRSMKGELQALGEEVDENIESVSKVQTQILNLTHGKVNIFEEDGETFRDIFEVFRDIANIMPELKETEQADLLEIVAGKNRSNSIQSMLSNWDEVETALQKATEAQGTAAAENDKYMKSAQGHIDALKAAWQAFSATFVKSDFLTNSLTVLTKFVDVLDVLVDKLGTVPTVLGAIAAYASTKGVGELINQFRLLITLSDEYAHEVFN